LSAISFDDWSVDQEQALTGPTGVVRLTPSESVVLEALVRRPNRVVRKNEILDAMYSGRDDSGAPKIVDVFVCKLRKKMDDVGIKACIRTAWGVGYMLTTRIEKHTLHLTSEEMTALKKAMEIADAQRPGIRKRTGL
jgi:DNA-binding response OmpR family regulator